MHASVARRSLGALIPPKIATPGAVSSGSTSARTANVVEFYSRLPKGSASASYNNSIKNKYFNQARGTALGYTVVGMFVMGYSISYYLHLRHHKTGHH
ncbi:mitochondrial F1-F0 ATP synthase subunit F of fungi-domain-containing protein [Kockovaella imperatae]|uniref:Mitochondrial F1-F0 ATP synthase subunit F of fungi-domain-containing protein n=1 Tax=Kockovaella imperatae TaxID=4999 RepID=A0A1Y1UBP3_9TREE|nr:mitochondrial F1-F0 ATP synthase subunit F of fungi-domain-containing protein [Kockovaella imperatae]ORX35463.1 mitochondrial F1-F0 ATP synthase subunit F of fungi-domain-containing protein [Kockovaella imperatae]